MSSDLFAITVTHRGTAYPVTLPPDSTLATLYTRLEEFTGVPPSLQKLLYKGKKILDGSSSVQEAGIKNGLKVQMIGSTPQEIGGLNTVEDEQRKKNRILRERALKATTKVCERYLHLTNVRVLSGIMRFDRQELRAVLN